MTATEVIGSYHDLWHVEQSFRMSKTDLRARPMFHRIRDAIEAHLTIVFAVLAVSRTVQNRTGLAVANVISSSGPCAQRPFPSTAPHKDSRPTSTPNSKASSTRSIAENARTKEMSQVRYGDGTNGTENFYKVIGAKGGKIFRGGGFAMNRELASEAGRNGGKASRRRKAELRG